MIVLDTTVLVYAKGSDHPLRDPCRDLIGAVVSGRLRATTSTEVIQEFAHVRAKRRGVADATALARDYAELLAPLLVIDSEQLQRGLSLFEATPGLGAFDAVLAAAALENRARHLVSADRAFERVTEMSYVFPDATGVSQAVG